MTAIPMIQVLKFNRIFDTAIYPLALNLLKEVILQLRCTGSAIKV